MPALLRLFPAILLLPCLLSAANLLPNGDFSDGLTGWKIFGKPPSPVVLPQGDGDRPAVEINGASGIEARIDAPSSRVLRVSGRVKWSEVVRGEKTWHRGAVILEMFDASGKRAGHREIFMAEGSGDWTRFDREVVLADSIASVRLQLKGWFVRSGTLWFSDIAVTPTSTDIAPAKGTNLIVNGDFDLEAGGQSLHWTFPGGEDWDGFALNPAGMSPAEWHLSGPPGGSRSLSLGGPATAVSEPITAVPGIYQASGWLKTDGVEPGRREWAIARIQVVFSDDVGRKLRHVDLVTGSGDTPWTLGTREIVAPPGSAQARIYLRLFDTARGRASFGGLALAALHSAPEKSVDKNRASLRVDFAKQDGEFPYRLGGLASHYLEGFRSSPWKREIARIAVQRMGVRSIRFQEAAASLAQVRRSASGEFTYDFSRVIDVLREVVDLGLTPMLVLESMPEELAAQPRTQWINRFPPADYAEWERFIFAYVTALADAFGPEEVLSWDFETWNEPEAARYFQGTPDDLLLIHRHTVAAARRALPGIRIGTPGFASSSEGMRNFLDGQRLEDGDHAPDFIAWHLYSTGTGIPSLLATRRNLDRGREISEAREWSRSLPRYITEWNAGSGGGNAYLGKPYNAAYALSALRLIVDSGVDRAYIFQDCENPRYSPDTENGYYQGLGLISPHGPIRPITRAFELLHRMQGTRVEAGGGGRPVDVLASANGEGRWVTFWNYMEDPQKAFTTRVSLEITGLPPSASIPAIVRVIDQRTDPWPRWSSWGCPALAENRDLWLKLDAETGLDAGVENIVLQTDAAGVARIERDVPVFTVVGLQIPGR